MRHILLVLFFATGCGSVSAPPPPHKASDIAVAAGRVSGGTLVVDVQVGASIGPHRSTGGTVTATTAAPLNP
jgi:hypothetical protein